MISKFRLGHRLPLPGLPLQSLTIIASLLLAGCPGNEDNQVTEGIHVHLGETHLEASTRAAPVTRSGSGGYDDGALPHHVLHDGSERAIKVYAGWLVLDEINLQPCVSLGMRLRNLPVTLLDALIPGAYAHAGHGNVPVGGRALDAPNVIDILTEDGYMLPLGDLATAPGRYCGVQVKVTRLAGIAYGKPEPEAASADDPVSDPGVPDLAGLGFALRADYCAETNDGTCTRRARIEVDDHDLPDTGVLTLDFAQPLQLSADIREAAVVIGIDYARWFADLDATQLMDDASVRAHLQQNIQRSLYVYASRYGELPKNTSE